MFTDFRISRNVFYTVGLFCFTFKEQINSTMVCIWWLNAESLKDWISWIEQVKHASSCRNKIATAQQDWVLKSRGVFRLRKCQPYVVFSAFLVVIFRKKEFYSAHAEKRRLSFQKNISYNWESSELFRRQFVLALCYAHTAPILR